MSSPQPRARLLLLKDFKVRDRSEPDLDDLRRKLLELTGLDEVELEANGSSTVIASVPARNQRAHDRLKALVNDKLEGWRVIEEQSYQLPTTF